MKRVFLLILAVFSCFPAFSGENEFFPPEYGSVIDVEPPASGTAIEGKTLFATFCGKAKCVAAFDLSTPEKPRLLSVFFLGFYPQGLALDPKTHKIFVADGRYVSVLRFNGKKFTLLERHLISPDPLSGPSDVALDPLDGSLYIACRAGGLRKDFDLNNPPVATGFVRTVSPGMTNCTTSDGEGGEYRSVVAFSEGRQVCEIQEAKLPQGGRGKIRIVRHGRQPGTIRKINGEMTALGFHGVGRIYQDDGAFRNPDPNPSDTGKVLKQFSCYGAHVYDFCTPVPSWLFLAAGEAGVISANINMSQRWGLLTRLQANCRELLWGNVNGIAAHPEKKIVYASDETRGLHAIDVSDPQAMRLLHTEPVESAAQAKGQ